MSVENNRKRELCKNCLQEYYDNDKFCRTCGTKRGRGVSNPEDYMMQCIYGPMPVERKHTCEKCGFNWTTYLMVDDEKFCPECGGAAPVEEAEEDIEYQKLSYLFRGLE